MKKLESGAKTEAGVQEVKLLSLGGLKCAQTYLKDREVFENPRTGERWTGDLTIRQTL